MKTTTKKSKIITDADFDGPMMVYNPMTKKQEKELGEWVANRKAKIKAKQLKTKG
jgi:hypothetical protein